MEKVLNQAEMLAEAILESEEYINMRLTEQAVMKDEEATLLVANYSEKRSKVEEMLANPNLDRGELAKAGQALQEAEHMLDHNKLIAKMQETNDAFTDMMKKVNKIIKKVVTGEDEEEEGHGCTGSCSSLRRRLRTSSSLILPNTVRGACAPLTAFHRDFGTFDILFVLVRKDG